MKRMQVTEAVIVALTTATGRQWGDSEAPGGLAAPATPYGIVDAIPGAQVMPDAADLASTVELVYQATSVGRTRREAEWLNDRTWEAILGPNPVSIDAYSLLDENNVVQNRHLGADDHVAIIGREFDSDGGGQLEGPLVSVATRYRLWLSPI